MDPAAALEVDDASKARADRVAEEGAALAKSLGLQSEPSLAVADEGNVADAIVELARRAGGRRHRGGLEGSERAPGKARGQYIQRSCEARLMSRRPGSRRLTALRETQPVKTVGGPLSRRCCSRCSASRLWMARLAKKKKALPPIHVRGTTATHFDDQTPIAGATVRVAELGPERPDGARRQLRPPRFRRHQVHALCRRGRPPPDLPPDLRQPGQGSRASELPDAE